MKFLWFCFLFTGFIIIGIFLYISDGMITNMIVFTYSYILLSLVIIELSPQETFSFETGVLALIAVTYGPEMTLFTAISGGIFKGVYEKSRRKKPVNNIMIDFLIQFIAVLPAGYLALLMRKTGFLIYSDLLVFLVIFFAIKLLLKTTLCSINNNECFKSIIKNSLRQSLLSVIGITLATILGFIAFNERHYSVVVLFLLFLLYLQYVVAWSSKEHSKNLFLTQMITAKLQEDLDMIRDTYSRMLPKEAKELSGLSVQFFSLPANEVGGDFYDVMPLDESRTALIFGDVMGHGLKAAVQINTALVGIKSLLTCMSNPSECISELNRVSMTYMESTNQFYTVFLGVYDCSNRLLRYSVGGHYSPIILRKKKGKAEILPGKGPAVGFLEDYTYKEHCCVLEQGDILLMYSDGFLEVMNGKREDSSTKNVLKFLGNNAQEKDLFQLLQENVHKPFRNYEKKDDVSFTIMEIQ